MTKPRIETPVEQDPQQVRAEPQAAVQADTTLPEPECLADTESFQLQEDESGIELLNEDRQDGLSCEEIDEDYQQDAEERSPGEDGSEKVCLNCGNLFDGEYCNRCGQYYLQPRLTARNAFANFFQGFSNFDRGIPNTVRMLFTNPGIMASDYFRGKRVPYARPFSMLVILCTILGLLHLLARVWFEDFGQSFVVDPDDLEDLAEGSSTSVIMSSMVSWINKNSQLVVALVMLPFFALSTKLVFRPNGAKRYNYTEMLYLCIFMSTQRVIIDLVILPLDLLWHIGNDSDTLLTILNYGGYLFFNCLAMTQFFDVSWGKAIWKYLLVALLSGTMALIVLVVVVIVIAMLFDSIPGLDL